MVEVQARNIEIINGGVEKPVRQLEVTEIVGRKEIFTEKKAYGDVFDDIKSNVKNILNSYPTARKSDLILCLEYWNLTGQAKITSSKEHIIIRFRKDEMMSINPPESISRARRSLQRDKEVEIDPETDKYRRLREEEMRSYFASLKED